MKKQFVKIVVLLIVIFTVTAISNAQVTVGFQGGESGDSWSYTSTGADATAQNEALQAPNIVTGTHSLVVGGFGTGGSCIDGGSGNGLDLPNTFTFSPLDISSSSFFARTLTFSWGNRFPACAGTGWDGSDVLTFIPYHNGVAQAPVTIVTGNNNATYSINSNQYTWTIPACVTQFSFELTLVSNRRDELLFIDNVRMSAPALNPTSVQPSAISGNPTVCTGTTETYSVTNIPGIIYTWSGLPAGASFATANGSSSISVNWGTAAPGTYPLTVTPSALICSNVVTGTPRTLQVTVATPAPLTVTGPTGTCAGQAVSLSASGGSGPYNWSNGAVGTPISVTPATTTTYTVSGAPNSCTTPGSITITVGTVPNVVVPNATMCAGTPVTLNATGADTYTWSPATGLNATTGSSVDAGPTATTLYTITGTLNGCSGTTTATVLVNQVPTPTVASVAICYGSSTALSVNGSGGSYTWSPTTDLNTSTGPAVTANPLTTTTYTVTQVSNGCSGSASATVTVNPIPLVQAESDTICLNNPTILTASGATSYLWSPATGLNTDTGSSVIANPAVTTDYTIVGTQNGCSSLPLTVTVTVHDVPATSVASVTICAGSSTVLSTSGADSYVWTPATGLNTTTGPTVTANPAVTTVYDLAATANGCTIHLPATVTVEQLPVVFAGNDTTVCAGNPIVLQGSGALNYSWVPAIFNGVAFTPTAMENYTVTGTTANGCVGTDICTVTVESAPQAMFTADLTSGCVPLTVTFTNQSLNGAATFNWDFGNGNTATGVEPKFTFVDEGCQDISLTATSINGCASTLTKPGYVCANPVPEASFTVDPNKVSEVNPDAWMNNHSVGADSYHWDFGDQSASSSQMTPHHEFTMDGATGYTVTLVAFNDFGCFDSAVVYVPVEEKLIYYVPNSFSPDNDEFNQVFHPVFTTGFDIYNFKMTIYNRWGQVVFETSDASQGWDGTLGGIVQQEGMYVWKIGYKIKENDEKQEIAGHLTMIR
jgi:gliding motility-associated-like protein